MRLQTQLTLSHLAVTLISILVLVLGTLAGYSLYLNSNLAANWAGENAQFTAEETSWWIEEGGDTQELVEAQFLYVDDDIYPANDDDWVLITDRFGRIIGSNYLDRFPLDQLLSDDLPPGITMADVDINSDSSTLRWSADRTFAYANLGEKHIGLAPVLDEYGGVHGWAYFYDGSNDRESLLGSVVTNLLRVSVGLALVALLVSGLMGVGMARYFGRKLQLLQSTSAAFAQGQLDQRVALKGEDEIAQLGQQFNQMADTISHQMGDLRTLADDNAQLSEEAEELARLEERNHLARELHDAVKQQLFGLNLIVGSIDPLIDSKPDLARERLQQIVGQTQQVQQELDGIIQQLRPASLQNRGLAPACADFAEQWAAQANIATTFSAKHDRPLPIKIEQTVYRILQEALQNIAKHAQASAVEVTLDYEPNQLQLRVKDNGAGFVVDGVVSAESFGLTSMQQRAENHGGMLKINSAPNRGTEIVATIPISDEISNSGL